MTKLTTEYLLRFPGFSNRTSVCHLFLAGDGIVLGELEDNKGTSVTNALEIVCAGIVDTFFDGKTDFAVFEWIPHDVFTAEGRMLEIKWHASGFRMPEWLSVLRLPPYAEEAESAIRAYRSYTYSAIRKRPIEEVDLDREPLRRIRRALPPLPDVPDRPPRPRTPELTKRERDILLALGRPLLAAGTFAQPASNTQISAQLDLSQVAVKVHLKNLYIKFGLGEVPTRHRRERLVNEAVGLGVITRGELLAKTKP